MLTPAEQFPSLDIIDRKNFCEQKPGRNYPFWIFPLILGIGVDDLFVMLAAWRSTSFFWDVEHRMSESYADAAVSITVTSLTNILAFAVGAITTFPSVQIFCLYTGAGVFFAFAFIITIQGAIMYFTGLREEKNLHSVVVCKRAPTEEESG